MSDDSRDRQDPNELERILRALADEEPDEDLPAPTDDALRAWREGRLPADEAREIEGLLARSRAGRRRLLELSGVAEVDHSLPLRRVRKAILDQTVLEQAGSQPQPRKQPRWISARTAAVAAAIAAVFVFAAIGLFLRNRALPEGLAYNVSARALAVVRSTEEPAVTGGEVEAYADTPVRIRLQPQGDAPADLSFALFRREPGGLRRVQEPAEVRLESERGAAAFSGPASRVLATRTPGRYPLFVVVSSRTELPSFLELQAGQDPLEALKASDRLVYPLMVHLLSVEEGLP